MSYATLTRAPALPITGSDPCPPSQPTGTIAWLGNLLKRLLAPKPWLEMPENGQPFDKIATIVTPLNNGSENIIFTLPVPTGYDGVIKAVYNDYTGPGFVQGSGDLTWRIRVGQAVLQGKPVPNYGLIQTTMGTLYLPRAVDQGIVVRANETITYSITHSPASALPIAGTFILACVRGYFWPKGAFG